MVTNLGKGLTEFLWTSIHKKRQCVTRQRNSTLSNRFNTLITLALPCAVISTCGDKDCEGPSPTHRARCISLNQKKRADNCHCDLSSWGMHILLSYTLSYHKLPRIFVSTPWRHWLNSQSDILAPYCHWLRWLFSHHVSYMVISR